MNINTNTLEVPENAPHGPDGAELMRDLITAITALARTFHISAPRLLIGQDVSIEHIHLLRKATGLELSVIESFDLGANIVGSEELSFPKWHEWAAADGIICLDEQPNSYLNAIQFCFDHGLDRPVIWNFEALPAQMCLHGITSGTERTELSVYNYFSKIYRIKDPLQLTWRVCWNNGTQTHGTRILGPNASTVLLPEHLNAPPGDVLGTILYDVRHPRFARLPTTRFRGVVDIVGPATCITTHGDEPQPKRSSPRPERYHWFDHYIGCVGKQNDVMLIFRRDPRKREDVDVRVQVKVLATGEVMEFPVHVSSDTDEVELSIRALLGERVAGDVEVVAEVRGRSFRIEWKETWTGSLGQMCTQGNHGGIRPIELLQLTNTDKPIKSPDERESEYISVLDGRGVMNLPYALPVLPRRERYEFSFAAYKFLPRISKLNVAVYSRHGTFLGIDNIDLSQRKVGEFVAYENGRFSERLFLEGGLILFSPPYGREEGLSYSNTSEDMWVRIRDKDSDDGDISELQVHNRNLLGHTVPIGFGQAPQSIKARTDMMTRFRHDESFDSYILLLNASPNINFQREGNVELEFNYPSGRSLSKEIKIAPQTWIFQSMKDLLSDGSPSSQQGWVRVISDNVALSAYTALIDKTAGRVSLQHLWGA